MNIAQQLINGTILAAGYACVAIGWTVLLGAARLVNFAHGQLYMLGAFIAWSAMHRAGVSYLVSVPVAVLAMAALGVVLQLAMRRLMLEQNLTSLMIVTLGFGYVVQGAAARIFGGNPQTLVSPFERTIVRFGEIWFSWQDVLIVGVTLVLFAALWVVLEHTRLGATVRAVAEDPKLAQLFGLNPALTYASVFVFEAATVAFAATLVAPRSPILTSMGFDEVILTFVVVVLGGIGSVGGTLLASLGLGMFTAFFGALVSPAYTTAAAFAVVLAVLVLRPGGLSVG
jgi:branched-chain amino acid transport system permease protein